MKNIKLLIVITLLLGFNINNIYAQFISDISLTFSGDSAHFHVVVNSPNLELKEITLQELYEDVAGDTITIKGYEFDFIGTPEKGCGLDDTVTYFDTTLSFPLHPPYVVSLNTYWAADSGCAYPSSGRWSRDYDYIADYTLSIDDESDLANKINIYPNPASNYINIETKHNVEIEQISLLDHLGRSIKLYEKEFSKLLFSDISKGLYLLKINTNKGNIIKKIIIL